MVEDFVLNMTNNNIELRKHCASAIFKCAQVKAQIVNVIMREKIWNEEETKLVLLIKLRLQVDTCKHTHWFAGRGNTSIGQVERWPRTPGCSYQGKPSHDCQTQIMMRITQEPENHGNKELMAAVTGALWKLSMSEDNVKCFQVLLSIQTIEAKYKPSMPNWEMDQV